MIENVADSMGIKDKNTEISEGRHGRNIAKRVGGLGV
jgi:hypothetical protein